MNTAPTRYIITSLAALATVLVPLVTMGAQVVSDAPVTVVAPSAAAPAPSPGPAWLSRVNAGAPGAFPLPRPFKAVYRFGWSDVEAGRAEVSSTGSEESGQIVTKITGRTEGLARALYQVDATHLAVADWRTLHPVRLDQTETESRKQKTAHVDFNATGAERTADVVDKKSSRASAKDHRTKSFHFPGMFDMHSVLLYVRSLPLAVGDTRTMIVMTAGNPYLATINVVGRGPLKTATGRYQAIECSLALSKINKREELEPHKSFKSAHIWLSDDTDRLILKAEAQVFIGAVTLDLVSVSFPGK